MEVRIHNQRRREQQHDNDNDNDNDNALLSSDTRQLLFDSLPPLGRGNKKGRYLSENWVERQLVAAAGRRSIQLFTLFGRLRPSIPHSVTCVLPAPSPAPFPPPLPHSFSLSSLVSVPRALLLHSHYSPSLPHLLILSFLFLSHFSIANAHFSQPEILCEYCVENNYFSSPSSLILFFPLW